MAFKDFYVPSIEINYNKLSQGQIFQNIPILTGDLKNYTIGVLMNPVCDLEYPEKSQSLKFVYTGDLKNVMFNHILSGLELEEEIKDGSLYLSKNKYNKIKSKILRFLNGENISRFYLLPPFKGYDSFDFQIIDFQNIISHDRIFIEEKLISDDESGKTDLGKDVDESKIKIIGQINNQYCSQLLTRLNAYSNRIGVPPYVDTDIQQLIEYLGLKFENDD